MDRVAPARLTPVLAKQGAGRGVEEPDVAIVPLDGDRAAAPARRRGVVGAGDFDTAVEMHGTGAVVVIAKGLERQRSMLPYGRRPPIVGVPPSAVPNFAKSLIVGVRRGFSDAVQARCVL